MLTIACPCEHRDSPGPYKRPTGLPELWQGWRGLPQALAAAPCRVPHGWHTTAKARRLRRAGQPPASRAGRARARLPDVAAAVGGARQDVAAIAGEAGAHVERPRDVALEHGGRRLLRVQRAEQLVRVVGGRHQQPRACARARPQPCQACPDLQLAAACTSSLWRASAVHSAIGLCKTRPLARVKMQSKVRSARLTGPRPGMSRRTAARSCAPCAGSPGSPAPPARAGPGQARACNARKLACTGCSATLRARAEAEACTRPRDLRGRARGARPHLGARLQARRGRRELARVPELDHAIRRACGPARSWAE